jgi:RNA-directed DNA polymerase
MTKSLPISKRMLHDSYLKVVSKDGSAGIDKQSIEMFNEDLGNNLYKLWNRMTSGSYFPHLYERYLFPRSKAAQDY